MNDSSKIELKSIAMKFAEKSKMDPEETEMFLLDVDRFKSKGYLSDIDVLITAYKGLSKRD